MVTVTSTFSRLSSPVCDKPRCWSVQSSKHDRFEGQNGWPWLSQMAAREGLHLFPKRLWKTPRKQKQHGKRKCMQKFPAVCFWRVLSAILSSLFFPLHSCLSLPFSSLIFSFFETECFYVADACLDLLGSGSSFPNSLDNRYKPPHQLCLFLYKKIDLLTSLTIGHITILSGNRGMVLPLRGIFNILKLRWSWWYFVC